LGANRLVQLLDHHALLLAAQSLSHRRVLRNPAARNEGPDDAAGAAGVSPDCRTLSPDNGGGRWNGIAGGGRGSGLRGGGCHAHPGNTRQCGSDGVNGL